MNKNGKKYQNSATGSAFQRASRIKDLGGICCFCFSLENLCIDETSQIIENDKTILFGSPPIKKGGLDLPDFSYNPVVFCKECYLKKWNKTEEDWLSEIQIPDSEFYTSSKWISLRYKIIKKFGPTCMSCKASGVEIHVDHIKPRSKYPHLALDAENLQVLCKNCNKGKSNLDETDWRPK